MRHYEKTWDHIDDLNAKYSAQKDAKEYKEKYLNLRAQMRKFMKDQNITPATEIAKLLGIK